jgi:hypothetical protein
VATFQAFQLSIAPGGIFLSPLGKIEKPQFAWITHLSHGDSSGATSVM